MGKKPRSVRQRAFWAVVIMLTVVWLLSCVSWTCYQFDNPAYIVSSTRLPDGTSTYTTTGPQPLRVDVSHGSLMLGWGQGSRLIHFVGSRRVFIMDPVVTRDLTGADEGLHVWKWKWRLPLLLPSIRYNAAAMPLWMPPAALVLGVWVRKRLRSLRRPPYACAKCRYDLRGSATAEVCPECSHPIPNTQRALLTPQCPAPSPPSAGL